ncbi:hypothetical protein BV95_04208 [Sphingobium chlorophenolicum]|uniref:Uncharacterized protein n=1 Tax=Sphingobium chlorophenolicum TaxID=46429 RepID=A0A081R8L2_SPHCR|nr:hypothetical protein BV95_04208 [Sphingobium chlorophenolicum]
MRNASPNKKGPATTGPFSKIQPGSSVPQANAFFLPYFGKPLAILRFYDRQFHRITNMFFGKIPAFHGGCRILARTTDLPTRLLDAHFQCSLALGLRQIQILESHLRSSSIRLKFRSRGRCRHAQWKNSYKHGQEFHGKVSQRYLFPDRVPDIGTNHHLCLRSLLFTPAPKASLPAFDRRPSRSANDAPVDQMQSSPDERQFYVKKTSFP